MCYIPVRTLVLLAVETLIVWVSFVLGMVWGREDWLLQLNNELFIEGNYLKLLAVTAIVLLISHGLDLYDYSSLGGKWDRLIVVLGLVAFSLAAVDLAYMKFWPGQAFLPGDEMGIADLGSNVPWLAGGLRLAGAATLFS